MNVRESVSVGMCLAVVEMDRWVMWRSG